MDNAIARDTIVEMYLDYLNNYLTVEVWARANHLSVLLASDILAHGRKLHKADAGEQVRAMYINPHA